MQLRKIQLAGIRTLTADCYSALPAIERAASRQLSYNLGHNKMEQQTPIPSPPPPHPKSRKKAREGQKPAIFPSLIWGEGESRFSTYFVQDCLEGV